MKKLNLLIACSFSLLLAGCNNEVDVNKRSAYTEEEKTLMIEKLNGNIIRTLHNPTQNSTLTFTITDGLFSSLSMGNYNLRELRRYPVQPHPAVTNQFLSRSPPGREWYLPRHLPLQRVSLHP